MTSEDFRRLALNFEDTFESTHMKHPDFRVGGKIFATLNQDESVGMVKLTPEQQDFYIKKLPDDVFMPCAGAWGKSGYTNVKLEAVDEKTLSDVLELAWKNIQKTKKK